ncbi:hypothetical protein CHS0354_014047 [Potamilus streckersoni]|uniref:Uncharacterized protein n=1 Tax=Potamilus streckersoni TaxID=2493646 RepID=A0AAE0TIW2_9BIVA|nr:hypothetical protein CHS0354_014047 [Potamilus streckersoni]
MNPNYKINCGFQVENWTRFPLTNPVVKIFAGALSTPPGDILPSKREAMVARKTSDTATGTFGTVSWLVEGTDRRIVLMWAAPYDFNFNSNWLGVARKTSDTATGTFGTVSWLVEGQDRRIVLMWAAPYDFNIYSNWLGVGITTRGETIHAQGNEWFNQMYYGTSSNSLGFSRSEYYWEANPVIYKDELIQISGIMSTGHQAQVKITVRPVKVSDLAAPIKALLEK